MLAIDTIHHVSIPVRDLAASKRFYSEVLGLTEIPRPNFPFAGAWYRVGDTDAHQLHLILDTAETKDPTFRVNPSGAGKRLDSRDSHFAIRITNYDQALAYLQEQGYREDLAENDPKKLKVTRAGPAGFPQLYLLDPDRHVIELNAKPDA